MSDHRLPERDRPWMMRTYAGHSTAKASNELYRGNLGKGQTGLSVAFDLPTQTGYDPDHELARGEVGKVGVPIAHKGDMHTLLDGIPLGEMNTSMTINATAAWLLALYIVTGEDNGVDRHALQVSVPLDISIAKGVTIQAEGYTSPVLRYRRCDRNGYLISRAHAAPDAGRAADVPRTPGKLARRPATLRASAGRRRLSRRPSVLARPRRRRS